MQWSAVSGVADLQIQNTQLQRLQLLRQTESGGQGPYTLLVHLSTLLGRVACALGAAANSSSLRLRADLGDETRDESPRPRLAGVDERTEAQLDLDVLPRAIGQLHARHGLQLQAHRATFHGVIS